MKELDERAYTITCSDDFSCFFHLASLNDVTVVTTILQTFLSLEENDLKNSFTERMQGRANITIVLIKSCASVTRSRWCQTMILPQINPVPSVFSLFFNSLPEKRPVAFGFYF